MPGPSTVSVHLLPSLIPPTSLRGRVAVVVDVLRATTVIVRAMAAGCETVIPCSEIDEARRIAAALPAGSALLAGERDGLPIPGFDLGNSPGDFVPDVCRGRTLVMTTSNGTRAILAAQEADRVLISSFANLGATSHALREEKRPIHIVCAGTEGGVSFEDSILAGAIVWELSLASKSLRLSPVACGNDEAEIVLELWKGLLGEMDSGRSLEDTLARGRGGRRVQQLGLQLDIHDAAMLDFLNRVYELARDPLHIVRSG
jgi:2-phosphosulfolactate phosphatase